MTHWRDDIEALAFHPTGHRGLCVIHRLALRTVIGRLAEPQECVAFFAANQPDFEAAARDKITRAGLASDANFHLTSRDVVRSRQPDNGLIGSAPSADKD